MQVRQAVADPRTGDRRREAPERVRGKYAAGSRIQEHLLETGPQLAGHGLPDEGFGALRGVADLRCRLQLLAPSHRLDDPAEQPDVGAREQSGKPHVRGDQAVRPAQGPE
ncbi:hypothetical protein [[Kitasatospora] papulosa]|uniref:hypothetical protein n=1 Tax=[Kitasatospora] papulosa TaxID=1464011 RepID=UPI00368FD4D6